MFGSGNDEQQREQLLASACFAGLRYLRVGHPLKAEQEFAQELYRERTLQEMIATGQLSESGTYNVIRPSAWGRITRITIMPEQGAGRTWDSAIPPEFAGYPTIEIPDVELGSAHHVSNLISALSGAVPSDRGNIYRGILAFIERESKADLCVSDLNAFAPQACSSWVGILLNQQAGALMDLLDHMAPLYESGGSADPAIVHTYWKEISEHYGNAHVDAHHFSALLVALEVIRAAYPVWPLGAGYPRFVCGRLECGHRLCQLRKQSIYRSTPLPAIMGASLGMRDVWSYFSKHRITLDSFLGDVLKARDGRKWLLKAAEKLREDAKALWSLLPEAPTVIIFYRFHFLNVGFTHAAELAYQKLSEIASSPEERSSAKYLAKEMDESLARSGAAVLFDLRNLMSQCLKDPRLASIVGGIAPGVDDYFRHGGIGDYRGSYHQTAQQSKTAAEINLDKWVYNEALFPVFWQEFVRGTADLLPQIAP